MEDRIIARINELPSIISSTQANIMGLVAPKTRGDKVSNGFQIINLMNLQAIFMELVALLNDNSKLSTEAFTLYNNIQEAIGQQKKITQEEVPEVLSEFLNKEV